MSSSILYMDFNLKKIRFFVSQAPPIIIISPPPSVVVEVGQTFIINCTALGVPTPEIVWRLNWGHVPDKCSYTSTEQGGNQAYGEITCPDAEESDQGAYSCEAINIKGSCFAGSAGCGQPGQDAIVVVNKPDGICPSGMFNSNANTAADCLECFCFGITDQCTGTELYLNKVCIYLLFIALAYSTIVELCLTFITTTIIFVINATLIIIDIIAHTISNPRNLAFVRICHWFSKISRTDAEAD